MTRVAVVEPFFRTSGVTTYAHHLAEGFRREGCDVELLTFTLSGRERAGDTSSRRADGQVKSGWQWSPYKAERVLPWKDAAKTFDGFDLVFLNEPRCAPLDKRGMRRLGEGDIKAGRQMVADHDLEYFDVPDYIRALSESETPWATCMHDPGYGPKLAPYLPQLFELAPPSLIMTHRPGSFESGAWAVDEAAAEIKVIQTPHLPYASRPLENTAGRVVGMTGRYINNKGQPTLIGLAAVGALPPRPQGARWRVAIGGASPLGAGPNHTFLTFESLTRRFGLPGERQGNGNVTTGDPWAVYSQEGPLLVSYDGPYDDAVEYSAREHAVHVNATEVGFAGAGSLEYADLEAVDAGCLLVVPEHRNVDGAYVAHSYTLTQCLNAELSPITSPRQATLESLSRAVSDAAVTWEDDRDLTQVREMNLATLWERSDPGVYARKVLSEAL